MKAPFPAVLLVAVLLAACSGNDSSQAAAARPPSLDEARPVPVPQSEPRPAPAQGDVAAVEAQPAQAGNSSDPCDLSGYDLSKMTVDTHEELVKRCADWKEQQQAPKEPPPQH